jgi:predicted dehydrogenase
MDTNKKIKWGIIGCGKIAGKFATDLALIKDAELTAVASRDLQKAKNFQSEHRAKKSYGNYKDLLNDEEIDIVYIATPHSSHAKWSIEAMEQDKHVLCEKPLSINKTEAEEIIAVSKRTGKFFMEALWTRFNPVFKAVKKHIEDGDLGEIRYINSDFSFKADFPAESRVLNLSLGGGAILDIGIYPAFITYSFLGIPEKVSAASVFNEETGCDMQTSMIFEYKNAQAILYSGFVSKSDINASISGTEGQIYFNEPFHSANGFTLVKGDQREVFELQLKGKGFTYEIEECHTCIRRGSTESSSWSHQNSLDLIGILDRVRKEANLIYPRERKA